MIPILYAGNEQQFLHNGFGRLADAITCTATEERNGQYELEMTYPISGIHYQDIALGRIIFAKTEEGGNNQAFIIYKISRPIDGIVTINAEHISYLLNGFVVMPFTATSCADAFLHIAPNMAVSTPFTFGTNVSSNVGFTLSAPRSARSLLGGEQGSILDVYGGYDYKFDNFSVYLYDHRGNDNAVTIRYGKNLTDLKDTDDSTNIYTGIVPFWQDSESNTIVYLTEKVVYTTHADDYPYKILRTIDFSSDFETQPTQEQLRAKAEQYIASHGSVWKPKNNIDVSFVNLGQTEEYKDIIALQRVRLCDIVTVIYEKLGVHVKTKVIKTVYNVLTEKYDSISLGDTTYSLAKAVQAAIDAPTVEETNSSIRAAVDRATKLIQGGLGGHVVFGTNSNGEPEEILIMDTDDVLTAVNVIRMNVNGIGFSTNGYNGPFTTAWTIDGHFVADFIDTGHLNADLLTVGTISDVNSSNYWNLETGEFRLASTVTVGGKTVSEIAEEEAGSTLTDWVSNTYSPDMQTLNGLIDGKAETWYQSSDPSTAWTTATDKDKHVGDLWYNTTNDTTWYYQKSGSTYSWQQQNIPQAVFDEIDGKAQIFITQPVPPYNVGDLWCEGASGDILSCVTAKTAGQSYAAADWEKKNKYTDNSALTTFITTTYATDKANLESQIDGKAETWYQSTDPATAWTTTELKDAHVGDLWYNTTNDTTWYYQKSGSTYSWQQQNIPQAVFDKIDGKAQIFITQPVPPYNVGDLWCEGASGDILSCVTAKTAGQSYAAADWEKKNNYVDSADVTGEINSYDQTLNQNAIFNKLTNNGAAQGIFLQNGDLFINGTYIQADTISASALTAQAKTDLQPLHNYLPFDIFDNISRWEINAKAVSYATITVDGQQKTALVLDGTDISSYTASYQTQVKSSLIGNPKVNISFKYQTDRDVTPAIQQFVYIYYRNTDANNTYYERGWNTGGVLIPANTEQSISISADPITGYSNRSISPIYSPKFGFRFFPNCKTYIYDIEVTSVNEDYTNAKLEFTVDGLDSTVQKGSLISNINQSAEAVTINASKINLTGALSLQGDFHCYQTGINANYAYLNDGMLAFFNNNNNVFTINSVGRYSDLPGIYFGDPNDSSADEKTRLTSGAIRTPTLYVGSNPNLISANMVVDCESTFTDEAIFEAQPQFDKGFYVPYTNTISNVNGPIMFYEDVYNSGGGVEFVSDRRKKRNIKDLVTEKARSFIMALKPVKYKFIKAISKSDRYHHGFIAQDVRQAMPEDWGLYCENKDNDFIGLRYDELIADMVKVIQDQEQRIAALERKVQ